MEAKKNTLYWDKNIGFSQYFICVLLTSELATVCPKNNRMLAIDGLGNCLAEQFCKIVQVVLPVLCLGNCETLARLNFLVAIQKCTLRRHMNMQRGAGRCNRVQTKLCLHIRNKKNSRNTSSVFCSYEQLVNNSGHFPNCVLHNFPNLLLFSTANRRISWPIGVTY